MIIQHCDLKLQLLSSVRFKMCYVLKNQTSLIIYLKWLTLKCLVIGNLFQNVIREIKYLTEMNTLLGSPHTLSHFLQEKQQRRNSQLKPVDSLHQELTRYPLQSKSHYLLLILFTILSALQKLIPLVFWRTLQETVYSKKNGYVSKLEMGVTNTSNEMGPKSNEPLFPT